jgi:hypothetical protein
VQIYIYTNSVTLIFWLLGGNCATLRSSERKKSCVDRQKPAMLGKRSSCLSKMGTPGDSPRHTGNPALLFSASQPPGLLATEERYHPWIAALDKSWLFPEGHPGGEQYMSLITDMCV